MFRSSDDRALTERYHLRISSWASPSPENPSREETFYDMNSKFIMKKKEKRPTLWALVRDYEWVPHLV